MSIAICAECGKEFEQQTHNQLYCSKLCSNRAYRKRHRERQPICVCQYCGKEFHKRPNAKGLYCSRECSWADKENNPMYLNIRLSEETKELRRIQKQQQREADLLQREKEKIKRKIAEITSLLDKMRICECVECGKEFFTKNSRRKFCSYECGKRYNDRRHDNKKRYSRNGKPDYSITLAKLFVRDKGICQMCKKGLTFECYYNSDDYPSIDHVVPISKGGTHTWDNVQLLCRGCNRKKSDKAI